MTLFQRFPVRTKIVAITMLTAMTALLLTGATLFWYESHDFRAKLERELTTLAKVIGANSVAAVAFRDQKAATEMLAALRVEPQTLVAAIYARNETVSTNYSLLATYTRQGGEARVPPTPGPDGFVLVRERLTYFGPIDDDREHQRVGTIYFETDLGGIRQRVTAYARLLGLVLAASCLVAFALSTVLQHTISEPIVKLASTTKRVAASRDYSVRVPQESHDEFGQLALGFNEMIAQIDSRDRALQKKHAELESANRELDAFSYSVSHDLRAPLRHINGYASLLAESDGPVVSETGQQYLENISNAASQMSELIDNLLTFAKMGRTEMSIDAVDLQRLAEDVVTALNAENPNRAIRWKVGPLPAGARGSSAVATSVRQSARQRSQVHAAARRGRN